MPKFLIERQIPGAGNMSAEKLQQVAAQSCDVLRKLGPDIQWVESYVTADKVYCVYIAPDPEKIREHAQRVGIPANEINEVAAMLDPTTGETAAAAR